MELVANAGRSLGSRGRVHVVVSVPEGALDQVPPGGVTITVEDNGCGMSPESLAEATKPGFTSRDEGSGLGLPLVASVVNAHRGRLEIESREGRGTTITIWLPRVAMSLDQGSRPGGQR